MRRTLRGAAGNAHAKLERSSRDARAEEAGPLLRESVVTLRVGRALNFRLYLITDRRLVGDLPAAIDRALGGVPAGAAAVLLREKDLSARALLALAREVGAVCRGRGAPFFVSDRLDVAIAAGADGVHLGGSSVDPADARRLLPAGRIGASCHDTAQLAAAAGADFALYSPVFPTPGKGPPVGLAGLRAAAASQLPIYALGGIDAGNAAACREAGAFGIAGIRCWLAAGDQAEATARLFEAFSQGPPPPTMTRPRTLC